MTSSSAFFSCSSFLSDLGIDLLAASAARSAGDLPLFELGLGEDVAVHLDEDLLDDLAPASAPAERRRISADRREC